METSLQSEDDSIPVKKHVTVLYHHMSYQNQEPHSRFEISDESTPSTCGYTKVPDYLPFAVLSVLIFMPLGVLSVMYSLRVNKAVKREDVESAIHFSNWAIQHALTAYVIGSFLTMLTFVVFYICLYTNNY